MNKKILSAMLMVAMFFAATSAFVSCKDYDDDIKDLQTQIDNLRKTIDTIQQQINAGAVITSVDPLTDGTGGVRVTLNNGKTFDIKNGAKGDKGDTGATGATGAAGKDGKDGVDGKDGKDGVDGKDGKDGVDGKDGKDGINGTNGTSWRINTDTSSPNYGYWEKNEGNGWVTTEYYALGTKGADGTTPVVSPTKYYVPDPSTGTFWVYGDGNKEPYDSGIPFIGNTTINQTTVVTGITAVKTEEYLYLYGVDGGDGDLKMVSIALSGELKSMVFVPHLYLDGIEGIEYPWIGDTILRKFPLPAFWKNLSHHTSETGDRQDIDEIDFDYLPNFLGRQLYYDGTTAGNVILTNRYVRSAADADTPHRIYWREPSWSADEWIYGPAWEVEYHLNPSSAQVDFDTNKPAFNVLEPDVVYYNTRAAANLIQVSSPEEFYQLYNYSSKSNNNYARGTWRNAATYSPAPNIFRKNGQGIVYVGLKIEHPDRLAPWPTDETINPNGNTNSNVSYPQNQAGTTGGHEANGNTDTQCDQLGNPAGPYANNDLLNGAVNKFWEGDPQYGAWYGWTRYVYIPGNSDNTIALQLNTGTDEKVTSDYALLVPTHVQLEGLIWDKQPMYIEPKINNFLGGPNDPANNPGGARAIRYGDEEGWAVDEDQNCRTVDGKSSRVHVWDSPEEALADPDGAALELYAQDEAGLDLRPYLGVHYLRENLKKRELIPGIYNPYSYDIETLHYGEEGAWGLHYEFELVDYLNSSNLTHDSRYASFKDWIPASANKGDVLTGWNSSTDKSGVIIAMNVNAAGKTIYERSTTSVDREPLVRVMLKNEKGDVLLDGYILIHINYTPLNLIVDNYPVYEHKFNLCDPISRFTTWSEFSKYILSEKLQGRFQVDTAVDNPGMEILSFDDYYWAVCKENPSGAAVQPDDQKYVTPIAFPVSIPNPYNPLDAHLQGYQLKIFNFGSGSDKIYGKGDCGNGVDANGYGLPPMRGFASPATSNAFENKELGNAVYFPNGEGTTNHTFSWTLSEEEIEYLTHDNPDALPGGKGVTVVRYFAFVAKDEVRNRPVNNYSAPYPYLWVKMTLNLKRDAIAYKYEEKINNYWYNYQDADINATDGWSGILFDIYAPGNYSKPRTKDQRWISYISQTMTADGTDNHYKLIQTEGDGHACAHSKYYFAPKEYDITCKTMIPGYIDPTIKDRNGKPTTDLTTYTITPRNGKDMTGSNKYGYRWNQRLTNTDSKRYREPSLPGRKFAIPAPVSGSPVNDMYANANDWKYMFCKYVYKHTYDNLYMDRSEWWTEMNINNNNPDFRHLGFVSGDVMYNTVRSADNEGADWRYINTPTFHNYIQFLPNTANVTVAADKPDKHVWNETNLKKMLQECAIRYNDGVFNDTILYAYNKKTQEYTAIAKINVAEQYSNNTTPNGSWREAGSIELIHWLPIGSTAADVKAGTAIENLVLYDILNALGYPMKYTYDSTCDRYFVSDCDFDNANQFINKQLRSWVGVVANNGCDVALYVEQAKHDTYNPAIDNAIEKNGPFKNGQVAENTVNAIGLTQYIAAPADPHDYTPVATILTSWQRPINLNQAPIKAALDANTGENTIYLLDYLKLFDWRGDKAHQGYMYDNHWWFWAYYNVKGIMVDMQTDKVWTNMHQASTSTFVPLNKVSTRAHLWAGAPYFASTEAYYGEGWDTQGNRRTGPATFYDDWQLDTNGYYYATMEPQIEAWMGISPRNETKLARFGSIYYENNGDNVTEFDVIIPITIFYEWGAQKYYTLWHIDTTHGRTN